MKDIITHKSREVKHCPPHFTKVSTGFITDWVDPSMGLAGLAGTPAASDFNEQSLETRMRNWLHENCEHRFYIGQHSDHDSKTGLSFEELLISFEDPADATYFTLLMSNFTKKK